MGFSLLLSLLCLPALFLLAFWVVAAERIARELRRLPRLTDGLDFARANPSAERVCILVPAHNEGDVIADLIATLRAQTYPNLRFVLSLDRCTDDTLQRATDAIGGDDRFEIIQIESCPEDWAGKVNALWTAVTSSRHAQEADLLLFADADTVFHPDLVAASVGLLRREKLDMLSLWSTLAARTWYERIVQPACGVELMYQYPLLRANKAPHLRRAFANGQFILFRRDAYHAIGGHQAVNAAILEDMALARLAAEKQLTTGVYLSDHMLEVRMYDSWKAFRIGWKRIFIDCAKRKVRRMRKSALRARAIHSLLPPLTLGTLLAALLGPATDPAWLKPAAAALSATALLAWWVVLAFIHVKGRFPLWAVVLNPVGTWLMANIIDEAASDLSAGKPVVWGGRRYVLQPR